MYKVKCVLMWGGISKVVVFYYNDMLEDKVKWLDFFLDVLGSLDVR